MLKKQPLNPEETDWHGYCTKVTELLAKRGQTHGHIHEIQRHRELEYQCNS